MAAEPRATVPVPANRAVAHDQPRGHCTRESTSTESSKPTGHTAAPICSAIPGDQPDGWWAAGSQTCSTLAAMDMIEPKAKPAHATNLPRTARRQDAVGGGCPLGSPALVLSVASSASALRTA